MNIAVEEKLLLLLLLQLQIQVVCNNYTVKKPKFLLPANWSLHTNNIAVG
jgi:hypothetical protein